MIGDDPPPAPLPQTFPSPGLWQTVFPPLEVPLSEVFVIERSAGQFRQTNLEDVLQEQELTPGLAAIFALRDTGFGIRCGQRADGSGPLAVTPTTDGQLLVDGVRDTCRTAVFAEVSIGADGTSTASDVGEVAGGWCRPAAATDPAAP